jgi:hypothetical protein
MIASGSLSARGGSLPSRPAAAARPAPRARHAARVAAAPAAAPDAMRGADEWMRMDQDPASRDAAAALIKQGDEAALRERFCTRLEFGGLARWRGPPLRAPGRPVAS